jgi:hypothetical protein
MYTGLENLENLEEEMDFADVWMSCRYISATFQYAFESIFENESSEKEKKKVVQIQIA